MYFLTVCFLQLSFNRWVISDCFFLYVLLHLISFALKKLTFSSALPQTINQKKEKAENCGEAEI